MGEIPCMGTSVLITIKSSKDAELSGKSLQLEISNLADNASQGASDSLRCHLCMTDGSDFPEGLNGLLRQLANALDNLHFDVDFMSAPTEPKTSTEHHSQKS